MDVRKRDRLGLAAKNDAPNWAVSDRFAVYEPGAPEDGEEGGAFGVELRIKLNQITGGDGEFESKHLAEEIVRFPGGARVRLSALLAALVSKLN